MNFKEQINVVASMADTIWITIKGVITNPFILLLSSSTVGIVQVFSYRSDLTGTLAAAVGGVFIVMTLCGLAKHYKEGEWKAEIFLKKTVEQFIVMFSVIVLGYLASLVITVVFKVLTAAAPETTVVPGAALYFIFSGYAIMFSYHFIKSCDLIDQMQPTLLPKWFSTPFRKFRKTGAFKDLLAFQEEEEVKHEL